MMNNEELEERRKAKGWNDPPLFTYDQMNKASANLNHSIPIHKRYKYPKTPIGMNNLAPVNSFSQSQYDCQSYPQFYNRQYSQSYSQSYQTSQSVNHQPYTVQPAIQSQSYQNYNYQQQNYAQYPQYSQYQSQSHSFQRN
jgi:hypothetical protein